MCTVFSSRRRGEETDDYCLLAAWHGWHRAHVSAPTPSRSRSIKETLVYTCVLITLRCLVMRSFWWGWKESTRDNVREGGRGGGGGFLLLLWMRYCLVVEHSWETSGHVGSTVLQKQERIHEVITTSRKESLYPLCLSVSFFTSLPFPVFFSNTLSHFPLSLLPVFALCLLCGFTSKRIGGLGFVDFWRAAAAVCCAADVMGESYRLI